MNRRQEVKEERRKIEKKKKQDMDEAELGRKDTLAMLLSAFLVIFPICVLVIVGLSLLMLWLFGAF